MKRYSFIIIIHILFLVLLSISALALAYNGLWFSTITICLILLGVAMHLYHLQMKQLDLFRNAVESLKYEELTHHFQPPYKNKMMERLSCELAEAFKAIRERQFDNESKLQYYRNLLDNVDIAVIVTSIDGKIEWSNEAAIALIGTPISLPGSIFNNLNEEVIQLERNGQSFKLAPSVSRFGNTNGECLLISLQNIRTVLDKNEITAWQKLTSVLTHEIMNSITPIISLSETLTEREVTADDMKQAIQTIRRRSKGLLNFVENYRSLTRIPQPDRQWITVDELFNGMRNLYPQNEIQFHCDSEGLKLKVDRTQIEQVLINLIKNAFEACHSQANPIIQISASRLQEHIEISIIDNGMGILPEVQERIFVPFFTTKPLGNGIGLTLCRQIMSLHEGSIQVISQKGKGSRFILLFKI